MTAPLTPIDWSRPELQSLMEANARREIEINVLRSALQEIAAQDPVEMALDPQWAKRVAGAALPAEPSGHVAADARQANKQSAEPIKGCAFCGRKETGFVRGALWRVACSYCDAEGPTDNTQELAIYQWNRRVAVETPIERTCMKCGRSTDDPTQFTEVFCPIMANIAPTTTVHAEAISDERILLAENVARHAEESSVLAGNVLCKAIMDQCARTIRELIGAIKVAAAKPVSVDERARNVAVLASDWKQRFEASTDEPASAEDGYYNGYLDALNAHAAGPKA
ncbi:hypothetical protein [Pararobbsia alpina]|uniref:Uncharacterized protein n=1 Tax=Pararobbsia alpina TaxID=621374 RepID=A0A6S7BA71_9BURK|nr:hypothetical protein [Pararobbsia alpina]CAB3784144.1 hypothetical protein LMG28138_01748 [Pararobbsia alpina]